MSKFTDEQLVATAWMPYTNSEIDELRLIEKAIHILIENLDEYDIGYLAELMLNGWCNAFCHIADGILSPLNKEQMEERIKQYNKELERVLDILNRPLIGI